MLNKRCLIAASILTSFLVFLCIALSHLGHPIETCPDCAMYLQDALNMLAGGLPYVDFTDINPPLIFYLNLIPAAISHSTNLHVITTFQLCVLAIVLLSVVCCFLVCSQELKSYASCTFFSWLLIIVSATHGTSAYDFGQREYLFLALYLPFFFLRFNRWEGIKNNFALETTCGVLAGIGLCIKPYFLVFPLLTEGYWWLTKRSFRNFLVPEIFICLALGFLYAAHVLFLPEIVRKAIFDVAANSALYHQAYGKPFIENFLIQNFPFIFNAMIAVLLLALPMRNKNSLIMPLAMFVLAAWLLYVIQGKGFPQYRLPLLTGVMLLGAAEFFICIQLASDKFSPFLPFLKSFIENRNFGPDTLQDCINLAFFLGFGALAGQYVFENSQNIPYSLSILHNYKTGENSECLKHELSLLESTNKLAKYVARYSNTGDHILVLSSDVLPAYPLLVQFNRLDGSRYPVLMQFAQFESQKRKSLQANDLNKVRECQDRQDRILRNVVSDAQKFKPAIILILGEGGLYLPRGFSFQELVQTSKITQTLLDGYHQIGSIDGPYGRDFIRVFGR